MKKLIMILMLYPMLSMAAEIELSSMENELINQIVELPRPKGRGFLLH